MQAAMVFGRIYTSKAIKGLREEYFVEILQRFRKLNFFGFDLYKFIKFEIIFIYQIIMKIERIKIFAINYFFFAAKMFFYHLVIEPATLRKGSNQFANGNFSGPPCTTI